MASSKRVRKKGFTLYCEYFERLKCHVCKNFGRLYFNFGHFFLSEIKIVQIFLK